MKVKILISALLLAAFAFPHAAEAQTQTAKVGSYVKDTKVRNSNNEPVSITNFGKKHILLFYIDPDHGKQNKDFTDYLEDNHIITDNIEFVAIVNLKDAPFYPNSLVRSIVRSKEKKNGVEVLTDPDHLLRDAWGLGDCNNKFVLMFITREGRIEMFKKGILSEADKAEFWEIINKYI